MELDVDYKEADRIYNQKIKPILLEGEKVVTQMEDTKKSIESILRDKEIKLLNGLVGNLDVNK